MQQAAMALPEPAPTPAPNAGASAAADFSDFDDLLKAAEKQAAVKAEQKAVKARQARAQLTPEDLLRIAEWEAQQWTRVANAALFETQVCECGFEHNLFTGLFAEETHKTLAHGARRWVPAEAAVKDLPNKVYKRISHVAMCDLCALGKGWDTSKAEEWEA